MRYILLAPCNDFNKSESCLTIMYHKENEKMSLRFVVI